MEVQTVPAHTSYTQYGQSYNTSHYQYTPSYAPSSYMPPSSIASGGHSHTSSSSSVPSSGWYSSHGPTSPRSPPRRPSLPIEMRETSANAGQSSSGTRSPPGAMSPRIRGTPF
ncbi:hypothetical protein CC85DRAFT_285116 [Cutaneotrichosporon oleaginosum]|uniref:Uncharacterized protein n=1 Tax=Cutaneotrichosporon oleaginosum TaxID=879819 RepID=A0A0J0XPB2_9TREE|nr:uncharacterized protein CC85DRAFT_285116 [Cutaneotrichosporon oleaginosum]KLT42956.1 hypothetical protein CC85DRAFT_285116 [Cutaneotrichosporon oleaginosum]TXT12655.1 hypothetical protein COLE_03065 [Cutaneotrichosporon oleaginosum]